MKATTVEAADHAALSVDDPASQPFVTAVGGTNLTMNGNSYGNEVVWNDSKGASGGGISKYWQMPSWQTGPGVISQYSSGSPCGVSPGYCREVPDVSLHSSDQTWYLFYCTVPNDCGTGPWFGIAGTSCAAPLWASITALTNEESVKNGGLQGCPESNGSRSSGAVLSYPRPHGNRLGSRDRAQSRRARAAARHLRAGRPRARRTGRVYGGAAAGRDTPDPNPR